MSKMSLLSSRQKREARRPRVMRPRSLPLLLELLEDRCVPATVTSLQPTGAGTLNDAILLANTTPGTNIIDFAPALFASGVGTINLTAEIPIKNSLILTGPGSGKLTINGSAITRIFNIDDTLPTAINVSISGLTLTNANAGAGNSGGAIVDANETVTLSDVTITNSLAGTGGGRGGAIAITQAGAVTLQNSTLSGNKALSGDGGGVSVFSNGTLLVQNSTITGNTAGRNGGGVYMFSGGNLTVQDSTISGNTAGTTDATGYGGGFNFFGIGTLLVQRSTISGNKTQGSTGSGGGIILNSFAGSATIENSTISGNTTNRFGGGIRLSSGSGAVTVRNSTIALNTAQTDNNGTGAGGGISRAAGTGSLQIVSTILAGNTDPSATTKDLDSPNATTLVSFSLIQTAPAAATFTNVSGTTLVGQDPKLLALAANGGPTQTQALGVGSPAINRGFNPAGLATDQRGAGFPRNVGGSPDIGAFETAQPASNPSMTFTVSNLTPTGTGSLNDAILSANSSPGINAVVFAAGLTGTINLTAEIPIKNSLILTGPGSGNLTINGSNVARIFNIDDTLPTAINVSISGLTLTNANAGAGGNSGGAIVVGNETVVLSDVTITSSVAGTGGGRGGAIAIAGAGAVTLQNSTLSGNKALSGDGGGVSVFSNGTLLVRNSTITGNTAGRNGGGVYMFSGGNLTVQDSTISGNTAGTTDATGYGGGFNFFGIGTLLVQRSTISGNKTQGTTGSGGGIILNSFAGSATIENSTISGNTTNRFGGGIRLASGSGAVTVRNSTIALNTAQADNNGTGAGGGISRAAGTGSLQIVSTILAGNIDPSATTKDLDSPDATTLVSFSLIQTTPAAATFTNVSGTTLVGQDPKLQALAANGGPTQTQALGVGSPAINRGFNPAGLATDQRGSPRSVNGSPDIGAVELSFATSVTVTAAPNPATAGATVTLTATVTAPGGGGTPTGTVTFLDGSTALQTVPVDAAGKATFMTSSLAAGNHSITAAYNPTGFFAASTSPAVTETVNNPTVATAVTLTAAPNPALAMPGLSVTLSATVTATGGSTPTGTVTFLDGSTALQSVALDAAGKASLSTMSLAVGSHSLTAVYNPTGSFIGSTSAAVTEIVNNPTGALLTAAPNPASTGQTVTLTATVTALGSGSTPTGTVTFLDGSTALTSVALDAAGKASFGTSSLAAGNHSITAAYNPTGFFVASTSNAVTETINNPTVATAVTLTAAPNPATTGQTVTLSATVTATAGTPTGTVTFLDGSTALQMVALDAAGKASFGTSALATGNHSITAVYTPTGSFIGSTSAAVTETVNNPIPLNRTTGVGVFDPIMGNWYLRNTPNGGGADIGPFAYGSTNNISVPVVGDWDGNGTFTIGVVEKLGGVLNWKLRNSNTTGGPDAAAPFVYGRAIDIPVVGDWDGNGTWTIGIFEPDSGTWKLRNSNSGGPPDAGQFLYGAPGWKPVVGDWDGNKTTTIGVFDPNGVWYLRNSNTGGGPNAGQFAYGAGSWTPVAGDWNNDGISTVGVFDPTGTWYLRNSNSSGGPDAGRFAYGAGTWIPTPGDFNGPAAERSAEGEGPGAAALTSAELSGAVAAALARLANDGVNSALFASLASAQVQTGHFGNGTLGLAFAGENRVVIDDDAAGHGWFVDPTPLQDEEFSAGADGALHALADGPAAGRVDLLTVVLHEFGHLASKGDLSADSGADLMADTLPLGVRRAQALDAVFGGQI